MKTERGGKGGGFGRENQNRQRVALRVTKSTMQRAAKRKRTIDQDEKSNSALFRANDRAMWDREGVKKNIVAKKFNKENKWRWSA